MRVLSTTSTVYTKYILTAYSTVEYETVVNTVLSTSDCAPRARFSLVAWKGIFFEVCFGIFFLKNVFEDVNGRSTSCLALH